MKKSVSVAPMMDCTDKHEIYFLSLISKNTHLYSEMIVANAIIRGDRDKLLSFFVLLWEFLHKKRLTVFRQGNDRIETMGVSP